MLACEIARHKRRGALDVRAVPVGSPEAALLMEELSAELARITGASGAARFDLADMAGARTVFAVAYLDGAAVGCGAIRPQEGDAAELKRMYARTKGAGVGRALLAFLEREAVRLGYRRMVLETRAVNHAAVRFYRACGYTVRENYGPYAGKAEAICFEKALREGD